MKFTTSCLISCHLKPEPSTRLINSITALKSSFMQKKKKSLNLSNPSLINELEWSAVTEENLLLTLQTLKRVLHGV